MDKLKTVKIYTKKCAFNCFIKPQKKYLEKQGFKVIIVNK